MPTTSFCHNVSANLNFWQNKVDQIADPALQELSADGQNIYRAVEFGLALPETWRSAAGLALDLHYFIEHSGSWRPWQILLQKALRWCEQTDAGLKLRLLDRSGDYYRRDRDWEASLRAHRQEESLARKLGKKDRLAQAQHNLAILFWRMRQYEDAATNARQALAGFQEIEGSDRQMGGVYTILGLIDYGRGNYAKAISAHSQAVAYFRKTDFKVLLARSLVNLALAQEGGGDIAGAKASYEEARAILKDTDYEMDKSRIDLSLGSLLFNTQQIEEAEQAYLRAYSPYLKRSGLVYYQGLATNNLGNVYLEQDRFGEAEVILRESLALWERANAPLQAANSTGALGKALAAQGKMLEAMTCFDLAIAGAEAFPEDEWAKQVLKEFQEERSKLLDKKRSAGQVNG